jgi:hypothetical protein
MFLVVLTLFVGAGAANLLGGRLATVTGEGRGYELQVTHAAVARVGQDAHWEVQVRHPGGFGGPIRLAIDSSYFGLFDDASLRPEPESATTTGDRRILTFDSPPGDLLDVELDGGFDQDSMGIHRGATTVLGPGGEGLVAVDYGTVVLP